MLEKAEGVGVGGAALCSAAMPVPSAAAASAAAPVSSVILIRLIIDLRSSQPDTSVVRINVTAGFAAFSESRLKILR
ncbi:MAG: hypothetical protein JO272_05490 [Pseudonocardiales bacterium]|nr:hypothetical protein [Pseudonocardiales bacterium]